MKSLYSSVSLQLVFVLLITCGFTCQKKYPQPAPEEESSQNEESGTEPSTTTESDSEKAADQ